MLTKVAKFSTSKIKKLQSDIEFREFRDPRYPLRLRFHKNRLKATWYFVESSKNKGKSRYIKIALWPTLSFEDLRDNLSSIQTKLILNPGDVLYNTCSTVRLLTDWYLQRSQTDSSTSKLRKATIKWAINKHIMPLLGNASIIELNRETLESKFFWPLQLTLKNSTIRSIWNVLKQMFAKAMFLKLISTHELVTLKFTHFIRDKIVPEATKLRANQLNEVDKLLKLSNIPTQLLIIMMLSHGMRIGETRQLKWSYFCFKSNLLNIPGSITKNGDELVIPLTDYIIKILIKYRRYQIKKHYKGVFVFPASRNKSAISAYTANTMVQSVSLNAWTSRSLRKIFRSSLLELGVDSEIAEMMINHRRSTLSETYIHTTVPKLKIEALKKYHEWLLNINPFILSFSKYSKFNMA